MRVEWASRTLVDTASALRVVETASPPTYYVPIRDVSDGCLLRSEHGSVCEWKGLARYWTLRSPGRSSPNAAWCYPDPLPGYDALRDHVAFFASRVDACWVGDERPRPQPGDFYGGWITGDLTGPFKGEPGSERW